MTAVLFLTLTTFGYAALAPLWYPHAAAAWTRFQQGRAYATYALHRSDVPIVNAATRFAWRSHYARHI